MITDERGTHLSDDELVLLHYGEEDGLDRVSAEAHLERCELCRDEQDRLALALAMVSDHIDAEPPEGFERVMWARVQPHVERTTGRGGLPWFSTGRFALYGAAAVLVVAAFVAGRWSGAPAPPPSAPAVAAVAPERVLLVAVGDHLERSRMVLVELLNADPTDVTLAVDRGRAGDLVSANRLIRQSASQAGEVAVTEILDDLERVLIEIANGADGESAAELQALKARIESRGILFRMRVVGSTVREREHATGPPVS